MHQHPVRLHLLVERIELGEQARAEPVEGLVGDHHVEVVIGMDVEQRHHLVKHRPVLPGDADDGLDAWRGMQRADQGPHLDGFRTGTKNR
ncbi:hypothetical protein D3C81_2158790 [compost metagenome]